MPTIHDLPLETIEHIITIAHPVDSDDYHEKRGRRHFYLDASLVCRDWTPFAQRALWKFVDVKESGLDLLVESGGAGRYPIEKLTVVEANNTTSLGSLLTSVRGVRDLKLGRCSMDGSWLSGDNWRDLKSLRLDETMVVSTGVPAYHYSLTHLAIKCPDYDDLCDETLAALSRQVSITSLYLYLVGSAYGMLGRLSPLASQLVRLHLNLFASDAAAVPRIVDPFLKQCTQLKHLTFSAEDTPSTIHVPLPLESWTLTYCEEAEVALILDVLNSKATAVSKLQRLTVHYNSGTRLSDAIRKVQMWEGWSELQEVCRKKKIRLSVIWREEERVIVPAP